MTAAVTVYVVEVIVGGVSQGPEVFATKKAARARMLAEAKEWAACGSLCNHAWGDTITPKQAATLGAFTDGEGADDCIMWECEVTP